MKPGDLTDEMRTRAENCKTPQELLAFCKEVGLDLTDEQLNAINGGKMVHAFGGWDDNRGGRK